MVPPTAASGATWPTTSPYVPPENRPSVIRPTASPSPAPMRSEEHTSELQSRSDLVCRLLLEKKKKIHNTAEYRHTGCDETFDSQLTHAARLSISPQQSPRY